MYPISSIQNILSFHFDLKRVNNLQMDENQYNSQYHHHRFLVCKK
jgi:hypothetical protein